MGKMFVLMFLGLILFLAGCAQTTSPATQYVCSDGKTIVANITSCPVPSGTAAATSTGTPQALTLETELSVCSEMPSYQNVSIEDLCIIGLATKHENTALCKKVASDQRYICYALIAEDAKKPEICLEAGIQKDQQCLLQYMRDTRDTGVCDKMTDVSQKDSCFMEATNYSGDPAICEKIKTFDQKNSCYYNIAMRTRDSTYCNKITNADQKQNCTQNIGGGGNIAIPMKG